MKYINYVLYSLYDINIISICVRLVLAVVCGGLLGLERGKKNRAAGFRTHILVCTGAALVMLTNLYMVDVYEGVDPSRMGAQVISGIGFLGAGTIMVTGFQKVKGLTTAAGLWVVACIGLAFGTGFYVGGLAATILCIVSQTILHSFESRITARNKLISVFIEFEDMINIGSFLAFVRNNEMIMEELELGKARTSDRHIGAMMMLKSSKRGEHAQSIEVLSRAEGVCYIEEIQH